MISHIWMEYFQLFGWADVGVEGLTLPFGSRKNVTSKNNQISNLNSRQISKDYLWSLLKEKFESTTTSKYS